MTLSTSALNYESNLTSIDLIVGKAGTGNLSITGVGWYEPWVSVSGINLDQNGFGRYRVRVNRSNLLDGQYSDWIAFEDSNGALVWVSVLMRVGETAPGRAGHVYGLLIDRWTLGPIKWWDGPQNGADFNIRFRDIPPGEYYLMVSTDLDNDFLVCDDGELCEIYPSNASIGTLTVEDRDVRLDGFRMGFPVPPLKSQSESTSEVMNAFSSNQSSAKKPTRVIGPTRRYQR